MGDLTVGLQATAAVTVLRATPPPAADDAAQPDTQAGADHG